ncbi:DUF4153 domain-containing protein [Pedobacter nototheniae]|uniref:DUF4153 domain-containing protein n=1 Tax=Pedobacter nototheniae TaxID=2488994 RepID=UPI00103B4E4E|nr:DUF4173 domain-containing protein [Pedobacter nototheniae]
MKTKSNYLLLAALFGGVLFNLLFWTQRLALNLLIYSVFILIITYFNKEVNHGTKYKIYGLAHLIAAILVVINNSDLTIVTYYISMLLLVGFSHYPKIRTVYTSILATLIQIITVPFSFLNKLSFVQIGRFKLMPILRPIKYIILPVIIVAIFAGIYSAANDVFANYLELFLTHISNFLYNTFSFIFKDISLPRLFHTVFGIILTGGLLITFYNKRLENAESKCKEQLLRIRSRFKKSSVWMELIQTFSGNITTRKTALKTEYIIGVISFVGLNLLLLSLNLIDITTLWFGYKPSGNFSSDLHQGTNALIFSIVMAMAVILYFFRANLNFYSKSKTLKLLAYTWMVQNMILIISVFIRDAYYIEFYGLTHKRIGVLVFAILCIIGLTTVYLKVAKQRTLFYLFKVNGNIWFILLLAFSTINWDVLIVKYNFSKADQIAIDPDYMLSLSEKTLPILDQNRKKLIVFPSFIPKGEVIVRSTDDQILTRLDNKIGYFTDRYQKTTWLSWNLQDWNTAEYFGLNKLK